MTESELLNGFIGGFFSCLALILWGLLLFGSQSGYRPIGKKLKNPPRVK